MVNFGLVPIGTVAAGFLTEWTGPPKGLAIMAVIGFVFMAVMFVAFPLLRRIRESLRPFCSYGCLMRSV